MPTSRFMHLHVQIPMLVDPIDNRFDAVFAPWPIRFYILRHGRIAYKAQARAALAAAAAFVPLLPASLAGLRLRAAVAVGQYMVPAQCTHLRSAWPARTQNACTCLRAAQEHGA